MKKIIFLDIDDTLIDHKKVNKVLDSTIDAINQARQNGHKVVLCTGRTRSNVHPQIIPFEHDGEIYGAGTTIIVEGQHLFNVNIPKKDLGEMLKDFKQFDFGYTLEGEFDSYCDNYCTERRKGFPAKHGVSKEWSDILSSEDTHFSMDSFDLERSNPMNKITFFAKNHDDIQNFTSKWNERYDFIIHSKLAEGGRIAVEIVLKGISKASGMDIILNHFNMSVENSIAFGDSMNDYEMIQHANIGVAMMNSSEKLKSVADIVCGYAYEDSIYDTFKKLNLI